MKTRVAIVTAVIFLVVAFLFGIQFITTPEQESLAHEQVAIEQLDPQFQSAIKQLAEPNVYFIEKDSSIILFSNLSKSGMYTYPLADIKLSGEKLIVTITSHSNPDEHTSKEGLFVKLALEQLPDDIEVTFLDQQVSNYEVIKL
ncbi:hypothetical protein [Paenibacillus sp. YIM B09110]|uniref:hypothetical protein n=1 Tax=Paenibacillus sp. YIM B09110 TaxID=3126102 RepID=UPI00301CB4A7